MPGAASRVKRCQQPIGPSPFEWEEGWADCPSAALRDAQLPGPGEDGVLDVDVGARVDLGVDPVAALGAGLLLEHRDAHAIGPELAVENGDLDLHALVGRLFRR